MTSPLVPVPQTALNVWRAATDQAQDDAVFVRGLIALGRYYDADLFLGEVGDQAAVLGLSMEQAGAQHLRPGKRSEPPRRLALLLRAAFSAAIEADGERAEARGSGATDGGEALTDALKPLLKAAERAAADWQEGQAE